MYEQVLLVQGFQLKFTLNLVRRHAKTHDVEFKNFVNCAKFKGFGVVFKFYIRKNTKNETEQRIHNKLSII
jgi:hypothetical protein